MPNRRHAFRWLLLHLVPLLLVAAHAEAQEGPRGLWKGKIAATQRSLEIRVVLRTAADGTWGGTLDIPQQGLRRVPLIDVEVSDGSVRFAIEAPGDPTFTGSWDAVGDRISGRFEQGGQRLTFELERVSDASETVAAVPLDAQTAATVVGDWEGTAPVEDTEIRWIFHISWDDGSLRGAVDAPDRGRFDIPLRDVRFDGSTFRLLLPLNGGTAFTATLSADGTRLEGALSGGVEVALTLTRR